MSRSEEDRKALDEAIIAIDASINTLVLARITLERRLQDKPPLYQTTGECTHDDTFPINTNGAAVLMCNGCGEQLEG